jgi:hypothetical protein
MLLQPTEGFMLRSSISSFAVVVLVIAALPSSAQESWQFKWQKGLVLKYQIKHVTSVVETLESAKNSADSNLALVNRWEVVDVDAKGVATLTMTLVSMRNEQKRANGETLLFDSENPDKSTPDLYKQMIKYIGATVAEVQMDRHGRVLAVKKGTASSFEVEPPFLVVLPDAKASAGQAWRRQFTLVLDPPYGTGEKYDAEQRYDCKKIEAGKATLGVSTQFKMMPDKERERIPLIQKDVQGELVFDLPAGRLISATLHIDKTIENHNGKGSSYHFKSQYSRVLVE